MLQERYTLNCRGRLLDLSVPRIMGILNVTPDSFYDGGRYDSTDEALRQAEQMLSEGATIIDIGGMSSRPGAELITASQEQERIMPVIRAIRKEFPAAFLSVDTVYSDTAIQAAREGIDIINDISAGKLDERMYETVADLKLPYILMEILDYLIAEVQTLRGLGLTDLVVDVGFGFGKSVRHNYQLLNNMHVFKMLDCPLLVGLSRKSMINKVLKIKAAEALNGTTALHMVALQQGARILRVHDVRPALEVVKLWDQLERSDL